MGSRYRLAPWRRVVAKLLLAASLLPTGPLLGVGLPVEPGFAVEGGHVGAPARRASSLGLASRWLVRRATDFEQAVGEVLDLALPRPDRSTHPGGRKASREGAEAGGALAASPPPAARGLTPFNRELSNAKDRENARDWRPASQAAAIQDPSDPLGQREQAPNRTHPIPSPPTPPDFSLAAGRSGAQGAGRSGKAPARSGQPAVSVPVAPDWNLLSISWQPGDPSPSAVLAPLAGSYTRVYAFDACDAGDPWKLFDPASPETSDLAALTPRLGFWLEGAAAATLPEAGPEPVETSIPLCAGWNLVGYPSSSARPVGDALASIAGRYLRVFAFDPADPADPWEVYDVAVPAWANDLQELRPGRGYWIYATEPSTLVVSNSGDAPTVSIAAPVDLADVTEPTPVIGTVRSPTLAGWELAFRAEGEATWRTLATGTATVEASALAAFDPTLLENGLYELRLAAADTLGRSAERIVDLVVDGQMKLGAFSLAFVDLQVPLAGLPIQVVRSYDSRRRDRPGDFGQGWALEVRQGSLAHNRTPGESWQVASGFLPCQQALELAPHLTTVRLSDQEIYRFRPRLSDLALTAGGCFATAGYEFVDGPLPGAALEILGNRTVFYANAGTTLVDSETLALFDPAQVRLSTRDGRQFELHKGVGVTRAVDADGNSVAFAAGAITHSAGATVTLERDAEGRIARIVDPAGGELLYAYDGAGDLVSFTDRTGAATTFTYLAGHYLEAIQDPLGRTPIRNEYGPDGRLTRHVDAFGHEILYDHQIGSRREIVTNRLGGSRLLEYDARGNVSLEIDETGVETRRDFDGDDQLLSEAVGGLPATTYAYDAGRNLRSVTDPLGQVTVFTYDSRGDLLSSTDPRGYVTAHAYDARGHLLQTTDPAGNLSRYTYDVRGNLLTESDALDQVVAYQYDGRGNLLRETDPLGHAAQYSYDSRGNRLSETRTRTRGDGATETLVTRFAYDAEGRLLATTAPDGSQTGSEYDALGRVTASVDALGRRTGMEYDELGRLTRTIHPDGTSDETTYDAEGRRSAARDRGGRVTSFHYDAAGRLLRTTFADGARVEQSYDDVGRLATATDARGALTAFGYDAAGRRTSVTDALGQVTHFGYDAAGNQTALTDPRGATTVSVYDPLGRLVRTVYPDGTQRRSGFDALGRRVSETDEAGRVTSFAYDALGRLTSVTDPLGQVTTYGYDELGNRIAQTDANGHTTRFEYDALGRQTERVLPGGAQERFTYDVAGQRRTRTDFAGRLTQYFYDPNGRLLHRDYPGGLSHAFTYTATGRRASMVDARGTTRYAYDDRDRVTAITSPDGRALGFAYDPAGNRTSLVAQIGAQALTTAYSYDALGRLATVTDPDGRVYSHAYDANGNRAALAFPNGVQTSYAYDARNRLRDLTTVSSLGETIVSFAYTLAPAGQRTRIVEHDGTSRIYGYDALDRLTDEHVRAGTAPDSPTAWHNAFTYDPVGNRLRQERTQGTGVPLPVDSTYDARDRLLTENEIAYGWDENGNQIGKTGPDGASYEWDGENRLVRIALVDGTVVEHTYDADGTRVRTRTTPSAGSPTTVDYLVDPWHQTSAAGRALVLSQVVAESDAAGTLTAYHVRGDDLLATLRPNPAPPPGGSAWTARYFHAEGIGTIRALTDEQGQLTDRYTLEAFGTLLEHQGQDPNAYLFAGEPLDPNSGFYYNRARWLNSGLGRFTSEDVLSGLEEDPSSLHKYRFAGSDPLNRFDPTGLFDVSVVLTVAAISAVVGAISTVLANYALNRPTTLRDVATGALVGAAIATGGLLVPAVGAAAVGWGVAGSAALVADVFLDPSATPGRKAAAGALLLASIAGGPRAYRYLESVRYGRSPVLANWLIGTRSEQNFARFMAQNDVPIAGSQIYVRNPFYPIGRRYDFVIRSPLSGELWGIELKGTPSAFSRVIKAQFASDAYVNRHGGVAFGEAARAAGIEGERVVGVYRIFWSGE